MRRARPPARSVMLTTAGLTVATSVGTSGVPASTGGVANGAVAAGRTTGAPVVWVSEARSSRLQPMIAPSNTRASDSAAHAFAPRHPMTCRSIELDCAILGSSLPAAPVQRAGRTEAAHVRVQPERSRAPSVTASNSIRGRHGSHASPERCVENPRDPGQQNAATDPPVRAYLRADRRMLRASLSKLVVGLPLLLALEETKRVRSLTAGSK